MKNLSSTNMKVFFATLLLVLFWFTPNIALAVPPYPLEVTSTTNTISVLVSRIPITDTNKYVLYNASTIIGSNNLISTTPQEKTQINGYILWELSGTDIKPNSTYYFRVFRRPTTTPTISNALDIGEYVTNVKVFNFGNSTTELVKNFIVSPNSDREAMATGTIDKGVYPQSDGLEVVFLWSPTSSFEGASEPSDRRQVISGKGGQAEIAEDGSYVLKLTELNPGTSYYFKQIVRSGTAVLSTKTGIFNTKDGYASSGTLQGESLFNSKTYHLLAPWPGLSVLMDPDLCLQKKAAKEVPENAICDVNGFLNFAFKLLIGLTAVILVLRLIYEGYQYIVTDIPFLKASAKSGFFTSLLGLLLALSAFLILNTINPKLVDNTISIDSVDVGVEVWDRADDPAFMARLDSVSTANITTDINDQTFLAYLAHQQGVAGANAILKAAKGGTVASSNITRNMSTNFNKRDAQKTIGTSALTPVNFLNYWSIKIGAFKKNPRGTIPDFINTELTRVSQEANIPLVTLQVMCRIESGCSSQSAVTIVNNYGYAGLFQLSNQEHPNKRTGKFSGRVWETYKKPGGVLLDAYHNAYAAAGLMRSNLSQIKK